MPELPEVQTIVDDLNRSVIGRKIINFWTDWPKSVKSPSVASLKQQIKNRKILKIERVGKNILFNLDKNKNILIHQKMTGHLMVGKWDRRKIHSGWDVSTRIKGPFENRVNQYIHAIFYLDDGRMIALSDVRKFAKIIFGNKEDVLSAGGVYKLGPDALDPKFKFNEFKKRINQRRKSIKQSLMDPSIIAGIGNIYANDILWSAQIHPGRPSNTLEERELRRLFSYMRKILAKAVLLRGSSVGDYRDASGNPGNYGRTILAYRRTGQPCKRCKTLIKKIKLGQRSAHFCPQCQQL